jgi:hypothetical protein
VGSSESKPDADDVDRGWDDDDEDDVDSAWGDGVDAAPEAAATPRVAPTAEEREARAAHAAAKKERQRAKAAEKKRRREARAAAAEAKQKKQEKKPGGAGAATAPRAKASDREARRRVEPSRADPGPEAAWGESPRASGAPTTTRRRAVSPWMIAVLIAVVAAGVLGLVMGRR